MNSIIGVVVVALLLIMAYWMGHSHGYSDRQLDEHDEWMASKENILL